MNPIHRKERQNFASWKEYKACFLFWRGFIKSVVLEFTRSQFAVASDSMTEKFDLQRFLIKQKVIKEATHQQIPFDWLH